MMYVLIAYRLTFESQDELNAWKSAFEAGISYALGDNEACNMCDCHTSYNL